MNSISFSPSPKLKLDVIKEENTLQTEEDEEKDNNPFLAKDVDEANPEEQEQQRVRRRTKKVNDVELGIDLEKGQAMQ